MAVKIPSDSQLSRIYGATRQMKRELQWFKEVESIVPQYYKERKNDADQTHSQVFTYNYKVLLKDAEKLMEEMATSYSVVGALIITVVFAATFTVFGGNYQT